MQITRLLVACKTYRTRTQLRSTCVYTHSFIGKKYACVVCSRCGCGFVCVFFSTRFYYQWRMLVLALPFPLSPMPIHGTLSKDRRQKQNLKIREHVEPTQTHTHTHKTQTSYQPLIHTPHALPFPAPIKHTNERASIKSKPKKLLWCVCVLCAMQSSLLIFLWATCNLKWIMNVSFYLTIDLKTRNI